MTALSTKLEELSETVEREFGALNVIQLNHKQSHQWSVGECLDHLITANKTYIPIFKKIVDGKFRMSLWEKINPLSKYTGKSMIKNLGPDLHKKYKSPRIFLPSQSKVSQEIVEEFKKVQNDLYLLFRELEKKKYSELMITSPVAALLTLPLQDALMLIIVHEERHINQAIRAKSMWQ